MESQRKNKGMPHGSPNDVHTVKQRKKNGPKQRELEKLFQHNIIDGSDTPKHIRAKYPIFSQFSNTVFAKLKRIFQNFVSFNIIRYLIGIWF